jgi:hypothetical protein
MSGWSERLTEYTPAEIASLANENRAWYKELRRRASALVNSKLAKQIGSDEYAAGRQVGNEAVAECKRRGQILASEMMTRACTNYHSQTTPFRFRSAPTIPTF